MIKRKHYLAAAFIVALTMFFAGHVPAQAAVKAPVSGEIEFITVNSPTDHWSGGIIVVGGQSIIIPRNLLIDLPANRVTLQQLFVDAPAACVARGETGLAKGDVCNTSGTGGFATLSANVTAVGNTIAGDVLIDKGLEAVTGVVTFINYTDGYFVLNGILNDPNTGVMVRLNDPTGRHTIQQGLGCLAGSENCSADPRFTLDPDNYTNGFTTGYPYCIPSTVTGGLRTVGASATGTGDPFCPATNRTVNGGQPVNDSRFFAPIQLGDNITAEGNFEIVNGVKFLSAHSSTVAVALTTKADLNQPDYLFMAEVFMDAGGFKNQRARSLFIGFATGNTDMRMWSRYWDPAANEVHEFPLGSIVGCDRVAGAGSCGNVGIVGGGGGRIFKLRYDVDFLIDPTRKPELYPCSVISNDPEWANLNVCPAGGTIAENFAIVSPIPHEIHVRSRKKTDSVKAGGTALITQDVQGNEATNGEYIFPFGVNLGGIELPEFVEIDLGAVQTPFLFTGLPWTLDRRLSPGGCIDTTGDGVPDCETGGLRTFALDPFPFEGINPTTFEATLPVGPYSVPVYTASTLSDVRNRILSYVTRLGGNTFNFDGNNTLLPWPPADPAFIAIAPTPVVLPNTPPVITSTPVTTATEGVAYSYQVAATDTPAGTLTYTLAGPTGMTISASGLITWTPAAGSAGPNAVNVVVIDQGGLSVTQGFIITVAAGAVNTPPAITSTAGTTATENVAYSYQVAATDTAGDTLVFALATAPAGMNISLAGLITWTPAQGQAGTANVMVSVIDQGGLSATQSFTIAVAPGVFNTAPTITSTAILTATAGTAYSYQVVATDTAGNVLTYALATAPTGMGMSATGLIAWTPTAAQVGTANVSLFVTDQGGLSATQTFTITVAAAGVNLPPTISSVPVTTATALTAYNYQVTVADTAGDTFTYTLPTAPTGMTVSATGLIAWTPTNAQAGAIAVTVQATDQGGLSATQSFTITVTPVGINTAPAITSNPITTATALTTYGYQVAVADTPGDTFTFTLPTAPAGMTVSATGLISWTPTNAQAGVNSVAVQATDQGGLSVTQSFTVTVTAVVINTTPAITSTPVTTATAGAPYTYQVVAADTTGDTFTYTLLTAPAGMTISTEGLIRWTPTNLQFGLNSVTVQVADQGGLAAIQSFSVTVTIATTLDTITVRLAEFRTGRLQWRVSGLATPSSNQSVTIAYDNGTAAGTVIGTANVVNGAWTLDVRNAAGILDPTVSGATRIRVVSTLGGTTTSAIVIRR